MKAAHAIELARSLRHQERPHKGPQIRLMQAELDELVDDLEARRRAEILELFEEFADVEGSYGVRAARGELPRVVLGQLAVYAKRKAAGMCVHCGCRRPRSAIVLCGPCEGAQRRLARRRYVANKAGAVCTRCRHERSLPGITMCAACRESNSARSRAYHKANRERTSARQKERWHARQDARGSTREQRRARSLANLALGPRRIPARKVARVRVLAAKGYSSRAIARLVRLDQATVRKIRRGEEVRCG